MLIVKPAEALEDIFAIIYCESATVNYKINIFLIEFWKELILNLAFFIMLIEKKMV